MKSNYQKVIEFNKAFGVLTEEAPNRQIFENKSLVDYRLSLVLEEVEELKDSIASKDFVETVDALADILYVVYGFFGAIGVDSDKAFDIVHKSNMSKLASTEEEAIKTVAYYKEKESGRYDSPEYRLSNDGKHYVIYNKNSMKILKNINYKPADFKEII